MKKLSLVILCTALGCKPTPENGTPSNTKAVITNAVSVNVKTVDSTWKSDKPDIQRLGYEMLQHLVQAESKDTWIVPTEPIIIDEIDVPRNLNAPQYQRLLKHHAKLCKLEDVYYCPEVSGVVHKKTKEPAWIFYLTIRLSNNGRLYLYDYRFTHASELDHGGTGTIDCGKNKKKFFTKGGCSWISCVPMGIGTPLAGRERC